MFPVYELQLVELHVLARLLYRSFFLDDFLLQLLNQLKVLRPRRSLIVELGNLLEPLIEVSILLLHQGGGILELTLQLTDLLSLFLDQLFHGLSKHVLQLYFFFFILVFNLTGPRQMFLDTLFHLPLRFGNFRAHPHNRVIFCLHFALERLHLSL